jgi:hypothetical protein
MQTRPFTAIAASLALAAALAACSDGATAARRGELSLALTDAPFPFDSIQRADIFVVRIDAKLAPTDSAGADDETKVEDRQRGESDRLGRGWVTVAAPNQAVNLLDLQGGRTMDLGRQSLPTGEYRGLRLIVDAERSSVTLMDGTRPTVYWPSASRTGIKVQLDRPITLTAGGSQLVLDFDLGRSFVLRGTTASSGLLFKPVIRATTASASTGSITGTVRADSAGGTFVVTGAVEVLQGGTALADTARARVVATTATDINGQFTVALLPPGTYALRVTPPAKMAAKPLGYVPSVTVVGGKATVADVILR